MAVGISTHVLDTVSGLPATGMAVTLETSGEDGWTVAAQGTTDADGRIGPLGSVPHGLGRLRFATGEWFAGAGLGATSFPEVVVTFAAEPSDETLHIPLLLAPHGYTTYRGS